MRILLLICSKIYDLICEPGALLASHFWQKDKDTEVIKNNSLYGNVLESTRV